MLNPRIGSAAEHIELGLVLEKNGVGVEYGESQSGAISLEGYSCYWTRPDEGLKGRAVFRMGLTAWSLSCRVSYHIICVALTTYIMLRI